MIFNPIVSGGGNMELVSGRDSTSYYTIVASDGIDVIKHSPSSNVFQCAKNSLLVIEAMIMEAPTISYGGTLVDQLGSGQTQTFVFFITDNFLIDMVG